MAAAGQISPELVLVCPELAERARAALPDRPWEAFLPRLPSQPAAWSAPHVATPEGWSVTRVLSLVPAALLAGFVAVVIAGSLPWLGERPTLGPPQQTPVPCPASTLPMSRAQVPHATELRNLGLVASSRRVEPAGTRLANSP